MVPYCTFVCFWCGLFYWPVVLFGLDAGVSMVFYSYVGLLHVHIYFYCGDGFALSTKFVVVRDGSSIYGSNGLFYNG